MYLLQVILAFRDLSPTFQLVQDSTREILKQLMSRGQAQAGKGKQVYDTTRTKNVENKVIASYLQDEDQQCREQRHCFLLWRYFNETGDG